MYGYFINVLAQRFFIQEKVIIIEYGDDLIEVKIRMIEETI